MKKSIILIALLCTLSLNTYSQAKSELIQEMVDHVTQEEVTDILNMLVDFGSRYSSHPGCQKAVDTVAALFESWGFDSVYTEKYRSDYAPNIIGVLKANSGSDSIFVIGAHIDATSNMKPNIAPGADDNGSGSTVTILAARILSHYSFKHELRFILFTGEENGVVGSADYARTHKDDNIIGMVNNDMVGYTNEENDDYELETNSRSQWMADIWEKAAEDYVGIPTKINSPSSCGGDHEPFWDEGFYAIRGLTDYEGCAINPHYHKPTDIVGTGVNDLPFLTNVTKVNVALMATLAEPFSETNISTRPVKNSSSLNITPNPFRGVTTIKFAKGTFQKGTEFKIVNIKNRVVKNIKLLNENSAVQWDGNDDNGKTLPAGIYFLRAKAHNLTISQRIILLK